VTTLRKPIKREVEGIGGVRRPIIVTLDPETKRIGLSEKGCRKVYWIAIQTVYALAIRADKEK
jgi:hypothetical protein